MFVFDTKIHFMPLVGEDFIIHEKMILCLKLNYYFLKHDWYIFCLFCCSIFCWKSMIIFVLETNENLVVVMLKNSNII